MANQNRNDEGLNSGPDQAAGGAPERMADVIDNAKNMSAQDLPGHHDQAREDGGHIRRAAESMATGNVPHGGDDPQHLTGNTQRTPMPSDTGGKGNVGDTPMKDQG